MVEETLLCPPVNQAVAAKKYLLYPLVNQGVRSVGAAVAPSRPCPGIGLSRLGQDLGRK